MAKALGPLSRSEDARRELIVCAVACAERALPLFEEASRGDGQAQQPAAIAAARACGQAAAVAHMAAHARAVRPTCSRR